MKALDAELRLTNNFLLQIPQRPEGSEVDAEGDNVDSAAAASSSPTCPLDALPSVAIKHIASLIELLAIISTYF